MRQMDLSNGSSASATDKTGPNTSCISGADYSHASSGCRAGWRASRSLDTRRTSRQVARCDWAGWQWLGCECGSLLALLLSQVGQAHHNATCGRRCPQHEELADTPVCGLDAGPSALV